MVLLIIRENISMEGQEKKWYVLRAIGGKEKKVKEYIENEVARLNLKDYISQVLIPTEKVYQIRNGKKISKERNYFPGYVLIEAALVGEIPHILKNITNVIGFLGAKGDELPTPLRMTEVNRILGKVDELAEGNEELNVPFFIGETVKVIDGPFNSFTGVIEEVNEEKKKLKVMVKIFGRKTPLELSFMQVEK
jgi:transcriptional antiterminator NusG